MPWQQHVDWRWDCGTRQRSRSQTDDNGDRPIPIFCTKPFDGLDRVWAASIIVFSFVCHFVRRRNGEQLGLKGEALSFAPLRLVCFQWVFGNPEHHPSNWIKIFHPRCIREEANDSIRSIEQRFDDENLWTRRLFSPNTDYTTPDYDRWRSKPGLTGI